MWGIQEVGAWRPSHRKVLGPLRWDGFSSIRPSSEGAEPCWHLWWWLPLQQGWGEASGTQLQLFATRTPENLRSNLAFPFSSHRFSWSSMHLTCLQLCFTINDPLRGPGLDLCRFPMFTLRVSRLIPDYTMERIYHVLAWSFRASWLDTTNRTNSRVSLKTKSTSE